VCHVEVTAYYCSCGLVSGIVSALQDQELTECADCLLVVSTLSDEQRRV